MNAIEQQYSLVPLMLVTITLSSLDEQGFAAVRVYRVQDECMPDLIVGRAACPLVVDATQLR
jgi:hypothetical protein